MGVLEEMADKLADDTMKAQDKLGDMYIYTEVAKIIGAGSTTLEEAYLTSMRVRLAERRGRAELQRIISERIAAKKAAKSD